VKRQNLGSRGGKVCHRELVVAILKQSWVANNLKMPPGERFAKDVQKQKGLEKGSQSKKKTYIRAWH